MKFFARKTAAETPPRLEEAANKHEAGEKLDASVRTFLLLAKLFRAETEKNDAKIEEIAASLREYSAGGEAIIKKSRSVANIAHKMREDTSDIAGLLENIVKQISIVKDQHDVIIAGIMRLGDQVTKIKDFAGDINAITDQTKVIAFNAALEAAGAGENGKRFSIVSSEINRLSDDVAKITKRINSQIEDIFGAFSTLIVSSEAGAEQIDLGGKFIAKLSEAFKMIESGSELVETESEKAFSMGDRQAELASSLKNRIASLGNISAGSASSRFDEAAGDIARFAAELALARNDNAPK